MILRGLTPDCSVPRVKKKGWAAACGSEGSSTKAELGGILPDFQHWRGRLQSHTDDLHLPLESLGSSKPRDRSSPPLWDAVFSCSDSSPTGASCSLLTGEEDNQFRLCFPAYSHLHCKQMTLPTVFSLANSNHKSLACSGFFFPFSISTKSYLSLFASDWSTTLSLLQSTKKKGIKRLLPPPPAAELAPGTRSGLSALASCFS